MMRVARNPRLLMCPPAHYGVEYVINPWMEEGRAHVVRDEAARQWDALRATLVRCLGVKTVTVAPQPGLPDMVFTANAGLVAGDLFVPSRFRYAERAGEEIPFTAWAQDAGFAVSPLAEGIRFEGAGDALYDRARPILWMGHGFRTDPEAAPALDRKLSPLRFSVVPLRLINPRFYHLDTCFCPLAGGHTLYYPAAFAPESRALIEDLVPADQRIAVSEEDALRFACNAVNVGNGIVLSAASDALTTELEARGFRVCATPFSEFLCAGGAAKCLTLRLDDPQPMPGACK